MVGEMKERKEKNKVGLEKGLGYAVFISQPGDWVT
jgi:hypothetical protein